MKLAAVPPVDDHLIVAVRKCIGILLEGIQYLFTTCLVTCLWTYQRCLWCSVQVLEWILLSPVSLPVSERTGGVFDVDDFSRKLNGTCNSEFVFRSFYKELFTQNECEGENSLPLRSIYTVLKLHWGPSCTKQTRKHHNFMRTLRLQPPYVLQ